MKGGARKGGGTPPTTMKNTEGEREGGEVSPPRNRHLCI